MLTTMRYTVSRMLAGLLFLTLAQHAQALPLLTMTPTQSTFFVSSGSSISVTGDIINRTNTGLDSTELFLNFSDFDPASLTPSQQLGLVVFHIPSFSFQSAVVLFTIDIAPDAMAGMRTLDVLLQDVRGNVSDITTFTVNIDQIAAVPQPATLALILAGLPMPILMLLRRPRRFAEKGGHHGYRC